LAQQTTSGEGPRSRLLTRLHAHGTEQLLDLRTAALRTFDRAMLIMFGKSLNFQKNFLALFALILVGRHGFPFDLAAAAAGVAVPSLLNS
jgi:hypothetical protein